jgi:hypothetical protein
MNLYEVIEGYISDANDAEDQDLTEEEVNRLRDLDLYIKGVFEDVQLVLRTSMRPEEIK